MEYCVKSMNDEYVTILSNSSIWVTPDASKAFLFKSREKARNVARHGISNNIKKRYGRFFVCAVERKPTVIIPRTIKAESEPVQTLAHMQVQEVQAHQIAENFFVEIKNLIDENKSDISDRLSEIDLELSDMLHYIEFHKFSACEGYKLCKRLQEVLDRRRVIKNEMKAVQETERIYDPLSITDKIRHQNYVPRILNTLFDENKSRIRA